jgi:hypothetical protein
MTRRDPEPRLLTQGQAAAYCGVCAEVFKKACPVPPVKMLDRIPRYDRHALDRWIDSLDNLRHVAPVDAGDDLRAMWNAGQHGARTGH